MSLLRKTLKSFTKKERLLSFLLLTVFALSGVAFIIQGGAQNLRQDQIYTEAIVGDLLHLNPVYTEFSEADRDVSSLIFSGLSRYNAQTASFEEDIATHTLSEDKLTYTFTLKNEATWHDGTPVSAEDILFTYQGVIQSPEFSNPVLKSNFEGVKIEALNSRTASFTLSSPNSFFFSSLTVGLLPKHILGEVPVTDLDTHEFNRNPIGSGPYQVVAAYETDSDGINQIDLSFYENYYGKESQIKRLRFLVHPQFDVLVSERSRWKGMARVPQNELNTVNPDNSLIAHQYELPQYSALFLNTDAEKLLSSKMRLGVSKAINKTEIIDAIGYKVQIDTPLLQLNQEDWLLTYDIEEAQGAFFDSGWSLNSETGLRENEEGEPLTFNLVRRNFSSSNPIQEEVTKQTALLIQKQLKAAGADLKITAYEAEELQSIIQNRSYDMLLLGQSLGSNLDIFAYWHSSQASESGLNLSNYQNPRADFYIEKIRSSFDDAEKEEALEELASIISGDVPAVFLYTPSYYYLQDPKVTGLDFKKLLLPKDRFSNIDEWTLN